MEHAVFYAKRDTITVCDDTGVMRPKATNLMTIMSILFPSVQDRTQTRLMVIFRAFSEAMSRPRDISLA